MRKLSQTLISATLLTVGCVDDNVSVYIDANLVPTQSDTGCVVDASSVSSLQLGVFNVDRGGSYRAHVRVRNQLQARADVGRPEPNAIRVEAADISILAPGGALVPLNGLPNPFRQEISGFIPPATSPTSPGSGLSDITLIPDAYREQLASLDLSSVTVAVVLQATTLGDIDIETGAWNFPINLCTGDCLFQCLTGSDTEPVIACNPGQDGISYMRCE